ncbi:putative dehydrogenase [Pararobbsia alpina]|uniref:Gfo/Idh/MocA family protein n=1 Tax=Pararobbsia alpina TaxID=621374 RepID=UPI0039A41C06
MSRILRVGIVGCGEVAQIIHLPALRELPELFDVTALCDVSQVVLDGVGAWVPSAKRYLRYEDLIASADVDVVLIANPHVYHCEVALAAMSAGKHVMVEKPMCINLQQADALLEAEARSGVFVQVGFMRRYAPAFTAAVERISTMRDNIILARVHDVIGMNSLIIGQTSRVIRGTDIATQSIDDAKRAMAQAVEAAIGVSGGAKARAYEILLGLGSHDISAMRELLGYPKRILHATQRLGGLALTAAIDYGHYVCQYETAIDQIARFDAHLEVYTNTEVVRVEYDTPYVRNLPAKLQVTRASDQVGVDQSSSYATRTDSFVIEWRAFYDNATTGKSPKTSLSDAREDLVIFGDMLALMD